MNTSFGNLEGKPYDINWVRLQKQCDNIADEYRELQTALAEKDIDAIRDALCDINVFSLGAHHFMGIDADIDMESVITGVMTRFCQDLSDLTKTMDKYDKLNVEYYVEGEFPTKCLKSAKDQKDINGENYPQGKFLKSVSYQLTEFYSI